MHVKEHATLISTYLVTRIVFQCLIIRRRRVFSPSPKYVEKILEWLTFQDGESIDLSTRIAEVIQYQFGLKPREQPFMYRWSYPEFFDRVPLPIRYKMPDYSKLRDSVMPGVDVSASTCQIASLLSWFFKNFCLRLRKNILRRSSRVLATSSKRYRLFKGQY